MAIISDQNFWNVIAIVISLNILYNNFDIIINSLLEIDDKTINQI